MPARVSGAGPCSTATATLLKVSGGAVIDDPPPLKARSARQSLTQIWPKPSSRRDSAQARLVKSSVFTQRDYAEAALSVCPALHGGPGTAACPGAGDHTLSAPGGYSPAGWATCSSTYLTGRAAAAPA